MYWTVAQGQTASPFERFAEFAQSLGSSDAGGKSQPFNGYCFRTLDKQGEKARGGPEDYVIDGKMTGGCFSILAYPAEYGKAGIMSFIVGKDGVVYQKDLGENTQEVAVAMSAYDPATVG